MKKLALTSAMLFIIYLLPAQIIHIPNDFSTIQHGIDEANPGDTVLVEPGAYVENINFLGKDITVASKYISTQDTSYISTTIIDGNQVARVVTFENNESLAALLCGFTITNGFDSISGGGGIKCDNSSPTLQHLKVSNNSMENENWLDWSLGGGIKLGNANPCIENVVISNNIARGYIAVGGGICSWNSDPTLKNVTISDNKCISSALGSSLHGAGFYCNGGNPVLIDAVISNNKIEGSYNSSSSGGCGLTCVSDLLLINSTITGNSYSDNTHGGVIYYGANSHASIINTIVWNNDPDTIRLVGDEWPTLDLDVSYSNIHGGENSILSYGPNITINWLEGNIDYDPIFTGTGGHPYQLSHLSPCVNTGTPDTTGLNIPELDLAGNPRFYGGRIEMGAYENQDVSVSVLEQANNSGRFKLSITPNPVNNIANIGFTLSEKTTVLVSLFNQTGRHIKNIYTGETEKGRHEINWNSNDLPGGIYFIKLQTTGEFATEKIVIQ